VPGWHALRAQVKLPESRPLLVSSYWASQPCIWSVINPDIIRGAPLRPRLPQRPAAALRLRRQPVHTAPGGLTTLKGRHQLASAD
jgi:hypothetical protein